MKRLIYFLLGGTILLGACHNRRNDTADGYIDYSKYNTKKGPAKPKPDTPARHIVQHDTICIAAVGDIMLGTAYPDNKNLPTDSAKNSFNNALADLQNADVTFGNLEGTLADTGKPQNYKLHLKSKGYLFRMPAVYGGVLKNAGFKVLSLANNHIGDFGDSGRVSTMHVLDSLGINYGGLLAHPTSVFKVNDVTYGFCAFAPSGETLSLLNLKNAAHIIGNLKQRCDIVIVSFHGGSEGVASEHIINNEEMFNHAERRGNVYAFAHAAIDAGADVIFGNGPHVCRAMEVYKNRLIAYSLGNFCTYKCVSVAGLCGAAPLLKVYLNKKGEFLAGKIISYKQTHNKGLERDSLNSAVNRIKFLTATDLPNPGLTIGNDGSVLPVKN